MLEYIISNRPPEAIEENLNRIFAVMDYSENRYRFYVVLRITGETDDVLTTTLTTAEIGNSGGEFEKLRINLLKKIWEAQYEWNSKKK